MIKTRINTDMRLVFIVLIFLVVQVSAQAQSALQEMDVHPK